MVCSSKFAGVPTYAAFDNHINVFQSCKSNRRINTLFTQSKLQIKHPSYESNCNDNINIDKKKRAHQDKFYYNLHLFGSPKCAHVSYICYCCMVCRIRFNTQKQETQTFAKTKMNQIKCSVMVLKNRTKPKTKFI